MSAIIINLLKSFWLAKSKFLLCVLAATLSAWGISTMVYSYFMTERDFYVNFTASNPADLVLTIKESNPAIVKKLKADDRIAAIERRETLTGRIKNKSGGWMSLLIFAADNLDAPQINKFDITENKNKGDTTFFVEKNGMVFLNADVDTVAIQLPGKGNLTYKLGGLIHDPGQAPSQMEQAIYGFVNIKTVEQLLPKQQRFIIKIKGHQKSENELRAIANDLVKLTEQAGSKAAFVIPPPGEHPHQNIVDGISFLQKSFGSILSLLGAILLSLILITWLYPQIVNVGIMKAVGASTSQIFIAYQIVLLLIIGLGLAFGLPLGYKTASMYSGAVAFIQNFTPVKTQLPLPDHFLTLLPALLIPTLLATIPLRHASSTSVHNALNHVFYTPYQAAFQLTQKFLSDTRLKYSINNLFRSNQRTMLLGVLLVAGVALFTTGSNLRYSLKTDFANYADESGYDLTVVLKDSMQNKMEFMNKLPFVEEVAYIKLKVVQFRAPGQSYDENSPLRIFPPDLQMDESRFIKGSRVKDCDSCIYFNQRLQADFKDIKLGDQIELSFQNKTRKKYIYSGVIKDIMHPGFYLFNTKPNTSYSELAIRVDDKMPALEASSKLDDAFLDNDIDVRQIADAETRLASLENHLKPMYLVIQVMGGATILIALAGLLIILNLSMQERAREMGIMKALGGSVSSIVNMYHREYIVITFISIVVGAVIGYIFNAAICNLFGVMVINVPVPPLNDISYLLIAATTLLIAQTAMISLYVRYKANRSSNRLLSEVF
jgi:putative ABC transport system permease protein